MSEFLDLNHTSKSMFLVSLLIPKFAPGPAASTGELRNRDTSMLQDCGGLVAPAPQFFDLSTNALDLIQGIMSRRRAPTSSMG